MGEQIEFVIKELRQLASKGMQDFLHTDEDGAYMLDFHKAAETGALKNIKKLTSDKFGKITIEIYDHLEILTMLTKLDSSAEGGKKPEESNESFENVVARAMRELSEVEIDIDEELEDDS